VDREGLVSTSTREQPHLLIVDDEESVRSSLRRALRKEPYRLSFAASAQEALDIMRQDRPDLLLSDHLMPQMTGIELVRRVRLLYPDVGRLILTGQAELETVIAAINEGEVFRFLRKPWEDEELKLTLHLALEQIRTDRETRRLVAQARAEAQRRAEAERAGSSIRRDASGAILIEEDTAAGI
jgi:DNA-binding NtrC family response regulator